MLPCILGRTYVQSLQEPRLGSIYTFTLYSDRQGFGAQAERAVGIGQSKSMLDCLTVEVFKLVRCLLFATPSLTK